MAQKLTPLQPPFSPEIEGALARYPRQDGYLLKLFRVFANSLRFLTKGVPNLLDKDSPLMLREREIVILRVTANNHCEYEWGVHVAAFSKAARFTQAQVEATRLKSPLVDCWSSTERVLIAVVDQLCCSGRLENETSLAMQAHWSKEQQLEICTLCGTYQTISYVANIAELGNESFAPRFPV